MVITETIKVALCSSGKAVGSFLHLLAIGGLKRRMALKETELETCREKRGSPNLAWLHGWFALEDVEKGMLE